jgi:predicted nucleotidyltransferase component of viral defense system
MKERSPEQLKGQIRSFAGKRNLQSQEVLQMFLLERVLDRLSKSQYKDNFILKGGMLISSMLGIAERTTMDMDTTVTGINMEEHEIERIICEILLLDVGDEITPRKIKYSYRTILDNDKIDVMAYNTETIIAEKI